MCDTPTAPACGYCTQLWLKSVCTRYNLLDSADYIITVKTLRIFTSLFSKLIVIPVYFSKTTHTRCSMFTDNLQVITRNHEPTIISERWNELDVFRGVLKQPRDTRNWFPHIRFGFLSVSYQIFFKTNKKYESKLKILHFYFGKTNPNGLRVLFHKRRMVSQFKNETYNSKAQKLSHA